MQPKKLPDIPEYYLYWTYAGSGLLKKRLFTLSGQPLSILETGVQNRDGGPDYKQALIKING
ncbi:MAG: DUF2851 family protein, partial [Calditrichia bacterium]